MEITQESEVFKDGSLFIFNPCGIGSFLIKKIDKENLIEITINHRSKKIEFDLHESQVVKLIEFLKKQIT